MISDQRLPMAYIEFLQTMGNGTDHTFLRGESCFMDELLELNEGENPPVYFYSEGKKKDGFYKITDTFTEFLQRRYIKDRYIFQKKE